MKFGSGVDLTSFQRTRLQENQTLLLAALGHKGKHVYGGTVHPDEIVRRRRRNRAGRKVRAAQRRAARR